MDENSEQGQPCVNCGEIPEQVIKLCCEHAICLYCSIWSIQKNSLDEENLVNEIICNECDQITELTPEVKETLIQIMKDNQWMNNSRATQKEEKENPSDYSMEIEESNRPSSEE